MEFCSFVNLHSHGSFHPRRHGCVLQQRHCPASTVCLISILIVTVIHLNSQVDNTWRLYCSISIHSPIQGLSRHYLIYIVAELHHSVWFLRNGTIPLRWINCSMYAISHIIAPFSISWHITGMTGLVGVFVPFGRTMDLIFAIGGCLLFSGYIVYDTYMINKHLSPDEYIIGAISLYLECVPHF